MLGNPYRVSKIKVFGACTEEERRYLFTAFVRAIGFVTISMEVNLKASNVIVS
jgi:hypothetical protein